VILKRFNSAGAREESFNMTPLIDIVFLLIIFFLVISQFIDAENFPVAVADECDFAEIDMGHQGQISTVTVLLDEQGRSIFAVGAEKLSEVDGEAVTGRLAGLIDKNLEGTSPDKRVVTLRIDKDVCFSDAQYALAAIAASSATDVRMAVLKNKRAE
jgi:biopolymer transport protein ExbD